MQPTPRESATARRLTEAVVEFAAAFEEGFESRRRAREARHLPASPTPAPAADRSPLLVSAREAATMLGISRGSLANLTVPRGALPVVRLRTRVLYAVSDLEAALHRFRSVSEPSGKDLMGKHEWCFYGWKEGAAHVLLGPSNATDVWRVKKVNPQSMVQLSEKPVELAERAMQYSSRAGENVLDLFGGSGSTLIGAERTGRRAFLMELVPLYCDVIVKRWEEFTGRSGVRSTTAWPS